MTHLAIVLGTALVLLLQAPLSRPALAACAGCAANGVVEGGEACDDGNSDDTDACHDDCTANSCGDDAWLNGVEGCDDGNLVNGDGCSSTCTLEGPDVELATVLGATKSLLKLKELGPGEIENIEAMMFRYGGTVYERTGVLANAANDSAPVAALEASIQKDIKTSRKITEAFEKVQARISSGAMMLSAAMLQSMTPDELEQFAGTLSPDTVTRYAALYPDLFCSATQGGCLTMDRRNSRPPVLLSGLPAENRACERGMSANVLDSFWNFFQPADADAVVIAVCVGACSAGPTLGCLLCVGAGGSAAVALWSSFQRDWNKCGTYYFGWARALCRSLKVAGYAIILG